MGTLESITISTATATAAEDADATNRFLLYIIEIGPVKYHVNERLRYLLIYYSKTTTSLMKQIKN